MNDNDDEYRRGHPTYKEREIILCPRFIIDLHYLDMKNTFKGRVFRLLCMQKCYTIVCNIATITFMYL